MRTYKQIKADILRLTQVQISDLQDAFDNFSEGDIQAGSAYLAELHFTELKINALKAELEARQNYELAVMRERALWRE